MNARRVIARNSIELAKILDVSEADRVALELQIELLEEILRQVKRAGLTHRELARLSRTSRTRVTAILNGNLEGVSTDLLLRILSGLGVRVMLRFRRAA
jgi:predicted XRE-type DNA-binding protein